MNDNDLFRIDKPRISIQEEKLIRELKAFSRINNGKPISQTAYNKWDGRRFSGATISRCFGSWEKGCIRAGVNFFKKHQYSDKELIDHFEKVWRWRGQRLVTNDLKEYNKKYGTTIHPVLYTRRWGNFQEFV